MPPPLPLPLHCCAKQALRCLILHADHNARAVGQISLVDEHERVLANLYVRPDQPVVSYLTPLTGLTAALLSQHGVPLQQVRRWLEMTCFSISQRETLQFTMG